MTTKVCFRCRTEKPITEFYAHKAMGDGYLNKCKTCTKGDTKRRVEILSKDPNWAEGERTRHRRKYHRLEYKDKHKPTFEDKKKVMGKYKNQYPEKYHAKTASGQMKASAGCHFHHWSYNEAHWKDVIEIPHKEHLKAHRFIVYDQPTKMYKRKDTGELLDNREKHEDFIRYCIENKED